ncbi:MAG: ribonuclease P protein component [Clostridia bacterium]
MRVERLKRPREFGHTVSTGRTYTNRFLVVFVSAVPGEPTRVGFAAARSAGTAVKRNRIRRRLRAAVAGLSRPFCPGRRIVVLGKASVLNASWRELTGALAALLDRAGCLEGD